MQAPFLLVPHAFAGRSGGVSRGIYAGLNCGLGSGDNPAAVEENRRRAVLALGLGPLPLATVHQVHGAEAVEVTATWAHADRPRADAMACRMPGVALGVLTADCAPVLLADAEAGVIGAAHAGWRGAVGGVIEACVTLMERLGARRGAIAAAIGPAIAQANYEVGPELVEAVGEPRWFQPSVRAVRWMFDLPGYAAERARRAGVGRVEVLANDTYADETRWFSYRRATHRGEPDYGRQITLIALPASA